MPIADFRHIAFGGGPRNCERLFRAAISAFCTLTRPSRAEIAQLDDLALGLFEEVSIGGRRFAAAALSECPLAPPGIVRRLCDEPVEISAPLLLRSRALTDVDLIALIGRHGIAHARAIARREGLHPVVAALIRALLARVDTPSSAQGATVARLAKLEKTRNKLRHIMQEKRPETPVQQPYADYQALRAAALSGDVAAFAAVLESALGISASRAHRMAAGDTYSDLLVALAAIRLNPEQAFLLTSALYPAEVEQGESVRLFLERFVAQKAEEAIERIAAWKDQERMGRSDAATTVQSLAIIK